MSGQGRPELMSTTAALLAVLGHVFGTVPERQERQADEPASTLVCR